MTAAHCADGVYHHEVVIGAHEIRDPANKIIDAYSPTVHPEWDSYNLANDLAILELETEIDFATEPNVGANCLAEDGDHTGQMALVRKNFRVNPNLHEEKYFSLLFWVVKIDINLVDLTP